MAKNPKSLSYDYYDSSQKLSHTNQPHASSSHACFARTNQRPTRTLFFGFLVNVGVCSLFFGYTLLGSFIFIAIENDGLTNVPKLSNHDNSTGFNRLTSELRAKTVENIWDITVSLNILYRENWTQLATKEILKFQKEVMLQLEGEMKRKYAGAEELTKNALGMVKVPTNGEWTYPKAFLYCLMVITTIGFGTLTPRTQLGKIITVIYATIGIPLTLIYLSSVGSYLSLLARRIFSRTNCCRDCAKCDELDPEVPTKHRKNDLDILKQRPLAVLQEPLYGDNYSSDIKDDEQVTELNLFAPMLCLGVIVGYLSLGAIAINQLESWTTLDGFFFSFMCLTTIGYGEKWPGFDSTNGGTLWFCGIYTMFGMALTAACFSILQEDVIHRLRHRAYEHQVKVSKRKTKERLSSSYDIS